MQLAQKPLRQIEGLNFFKLMGSGAGNGFALKPDFSVYALLGAWRSLDDAANFLDKSIIFNRFQNHSSEIWTIFLQPVKAHGKWSNVQPFTLVEVEKDDDAPVAVLTRASIRRGKLREFWRDVPAASRDFPDQKGLIFAKGIGELPVIEQATFSLWQNRAAMVDYAYKNRQHTEVIKKTRALGWYKEELFAEFRPFATRGNWDGLEIVMNNGFGVFPQ